MVGVMQDGSQQLRGISAVDETQKLRLQVTAVETAFITHSRFEEDLNALDNMLDHARQIEGLFLLHRSITVALLGCGTTVDRSEMKTTLLEDMNLGERSILRKLVDDTLDGNVKGIIEVFGDDKQPMIFRKIAEVLFDTAKRKANANGKGVETDRIVRDYVLEAATRTHTMVARPGLDLGHSHLAPRRIVLSRR